MRGAAAALVIGIASIVILWWSRRALRHPASHGFFRVFAFEAILVVVVLNAPHWLADPLSVRQLGSWFLLLLSVVYVVWGVVLLRRFGRPVPPPADSLLLAWEHTTTLVTTGLYGYVRHPMYASLLFLAWGAALKTASPASLALAGIATAALVGAARAEEGENLARWGEAYRHYMAHSRRFVPLLW